MYSDPKMDDFWLVLFTFNEGWRKFTGFWDEFHGLVEKGGRV